MPFLNKDVQPLAQKLIAEFGDLTGVLTADLETLCKFDGIKSHSAILLKLTDWIRTRYSTKEIQRIDRAFPSLYL